MCNKIFQCLLIISIFLILGCATGYRSQEYQERQRIIQRRQNYVNAHPGLAYDIKVAIVEGYVAIGMSKDQVSASKGNPAKVNRSGDISGVIETWIYYPPFPKKARYLSPAQQVQLYNVYLANRKITYLYFENNKLIKFEEQN